MLNLRRGRRPILLLLHVRCQHFSIGRLYRRSIAPATPEPFVSAAHGALSNPVRLADFQGARCILGISGRLHRGKSDRRNPRELRPSSAGRRLPLFSDSFSFRYPPSEFVIHTLELYLSAVAATERASIAGGPSAVRNALPSVRGHVARKIIPRRRHPRMYPAVGTRVACRIACP